MSASSYWEKWKKLADYERFERIALGVILIIISAIAVYATVAVVIKLVSDFMLGETFLDKAAFQDTFGLILTILIILEFNHSVYVAFSQKLGVIQVRAVLLITVMVIARKLMLQDFATTDFQTLLGFGGLLLAIGALYWMIANADRPGGLSKSPLTEQ